MWGARKGRVCRRPGRPTVRPATEYTLSFDWRAMGGNNAYLSVYLGDPETVDLTYPYDNPANSTT